MKYKTAWNLIRVCDILAVVCVAVVIVWGVRWFWIPALMFCIGRMAVWLTFLRCPHCHSMFRVRSNSTVCPDCGQPLDPDKM